MNDARSDRRRDRAGQQRSVFPGFDAMAQDPAELIGRLVELRRHHGLSQTEVAALMGTSQSALARLEAGQSDTRMSTLVRYAAALGTTVGFALRPDNARGIDE
jgi:DNA-binding XRE family transcriptional regulator